MSPSKATAKKAARYNLIVVAVVLVFGIWAVNKAQSVDFAPPLKLEDGNIQIDHAK